MSACPLYYKNKLTDFEVDLTKVVSKDEFRQILTLKFPTINEKEIQSTLRMGKKFFITLGVEIYLINDC